MSSKHKWKQVKERRWLDVDRIDTYDQGMPDAEWKRLRLPQARQPRRREPQWTLKSLHHRATRVKKSGGQKHVQFDVAATPPGRGETCVSTYDQESDISEDRPCCRIRATSDSSLGGERDASHLRAFSCSLPRGPPATERGVVFFNEDHFSA